MQMVYHRIILLSSQVPTTDIRIIQEDNVGRLQPAASYKMYWKTYESFI